MRFMVTRDWWDEEPPCEGAVKEKYLRRDVRTVADPTHILCYHGKPDLARQEWYGSGKNHRVEDGRIVRDVEDEGWFLEVPDLEALTALAQKHSTVAVVGVSGSSGDEPMLVIDAQLE